ncbi:MAG: acetyl-CoA hydrolase/transferase family protein [Lachnospiraceae bacterium]|nr:acetyl-CoA hydrolase/transferase family protein [Lachnospiraceae bacterium]
MSYTSKVITVEKALSLVKSGDIIVTGLGAAEGGLFMESLHTIADRVKNVKVVNCNPTHTCEFYKPEYEETFSVDGWFYAPQMRKAHEQGNMAFIPNHLHLAAVKWLFRNKPNIYVGSASMPDKNGYISISTSNTYERRMMEAADITILEINPKYPYIYGDVIVHTSDVDYLIEADYDVPVVPDIPVGDKDREIGRRISEFVPDGACLQLGIGGIPNAVAEFLKDKNDLGIHTEMITSKMAELMKMGVITNKRKQINRGVTVATFVLGTQELYEFCHQNPAVALFDGAWVNDPYTIAKNDNQISINTSLEIDLTGQCASESIGSRQFSGTGGQADTAIGAQMSKNGRSIIALYSTAMVKDKESGEKKEVSKIVPQLQQGAAVSLSRNDVDLIITEYGVADLRGANIKERVEAIINIAHPKFRDELWDQALSCGIIGKRW